MFEAGRSARAGGGMAATQGQSPVQAPSNAATQAAAAEMAQGTSMGASMPASAGAAMAAVGTATSGTGTSQSKEISTDPKFSEVLQNIQAKYGAKPAKPREIKKTLGKDDFLRIMVMQMKHQDPTSPFKADQMAAQMAQFASVEQLQNMNQSITKMAAQGNPMERMAMTNLIGKRITVDKERFPHIEGQNEALSFVLPKNAKSVKVMIVSESGETVSQRELGAQKAGEVAFTWDGLKNNSLPTKSGTYAFRVEAKDEQEAMINTNAQSTSRVIGVSFEGSEPVFLIGDAQRQEKVTMRNIIRIDDDGGARAPMPRQSQMAQMAQASSAPANTGDVSNTPLPEAAQKPQNFFKFQKGVGSENLNAENVSPEILEAIQKFQQQQQPQNIAQSEKGFPNGLQDPSDSDSKGGE